MSAGELPRGIAYDDKGDAKLPEERFSSYKEVQETCQAMIDLDRTVRAPRRAKVDGIINGNRPWNQEEMNGKGFGWMPNVNYLEAEGFLQAQQTPLYDLVTEVDNCIELTLDIKGGKDEIAACEQSIQKNFTWLLLTRWRKGFNYHVPMQQLQMLKHGLGAHVRPTKSWIPRTPRAGSMLFPSNAPLNFDEDGEYFIVRDCVPANTLHSFIRNEKEAKSLGWNPDIVWKALAASSTKSGEKQSLEQTQKEIRSGDIGWTNSRQAVVFLNYLFVKEIDSDKISQYIVTEGPSSDVGGYLFKKRNMYDEWPLDLFPYDIGDGQINSIRGLGERTAVFFELSNRLNNAMAAQVLISMFPQIKQTLPDMDPDKLKLLRLGALTVWPYGAEATMQQLPPLTNGPIALKQEFARTLEGNNQAMTGTTPEPKDRETKYSFMMRAQDSARVSNGLQSNYESNLQQFYYRTLKMVMDAPKGDKPWQKMAEEFKERCRKDKCPEEALKSKAIGEVQEVTSSGAGSAAARLHGLLTLMEFVFPNTTEDRKVNILRAITSNTMGGSHVDLYAPNLTDNEMPDADDSMATVESSELADGGDALVSSQQNPVKHAANHLAKGEQIAEMVQQGQMDPQQALVGIQKILAHAGDHIELLQGNPMRKAEFDQLSKRWEELAKFAQELQSEIESQAEQEQQQQQMSEEGQIKMAATQQDQQRKDVKLASDEQRKNVKLAADEQRKNVKFAEDQRRQAFGFALKSRLDAASTAAKIGRTSGNGAKKAK